MAKREHGFAGLTVVLVVAVLLPHAVRAADDIFDLNRDRVLPDNIGIGVYSTDGSATAPRPDRIRLFRIMPGFLSDPVGLEDDTTPGPDGVPVKTDDGPNWLQLAVGNDNPFLDVRYPGDPGGIGYTRVHTQLQLFELPATSCAIGFRAVTPAGAEQGGVEDGPTVISPAFSLFHALDDGTAFQGFISKNLHVANPANLTDTLGHASQLNRSMQYGMAVQRTLLPEENSVFWFVEALGRYRYDTTTPGTAQASMEVLPGMHLKLNDSWWLSGGVILPVTQNRPIDGHLWQITCSFQF
jgi:hypothetical protein